MNSFFDFEEIRTVKHAWAHYVLNIIAFRKPSLFVNNATNLPGGVKLKVFEKTTEITIEKKYNCKIPRVE